MRKILLILLLSGCFTIKELPPEPSIEFINYAPVDSTDPLGNKIHLGKITIEFTDGDGDIGLTDEDIYPPYDTGSKYYNNLFVTKFTDTDTSSYNFRMPVITPEGQNKTLTGELDVNIITNVPFPEWVQYEIYVADRALNESNKITTQVFELK